MVTTPTQEERDLVEGLLATYEAECSRIKLFQKQLFIALNESEELSPFVHSMKTRLKDPEHLERKLFRKIAACKEAGQEFEIVPENLLVRINDLAGVRILHLHTRQIEPIDAALQRMFQEQQYALLEGPFARTWDDESREFFRGCGIETQESPTLYTSVHYVIGSASRTTVTCEIQVRTLSEELWGEVDHSINYPEQNMSLACREQLKVLARVTSSASRLVDSIFRTDEDAQEVKKTKDS